MEFHGTKKIVTQHLVLRKLHKKDADQLLENCWADPKVNEFISFEPFTTPEAVQYFIEMTRQQYKKNPGIYRWAVCLQKTPEGKKMKTDRLIGIAGIFNLDEDAESGELMYAIGSRWWGNGYGTEAAQAAVRYALSREKFHRIYASCDCANKGSERVMQKLGMEYEGTLRDAKKNPDGSFSSLRLYSVLHM